MDPRSVSVAGRHYEHILELLTWFRTITIYDEEVSLFKCQLKNCVCFIQLKCYGFGHCSLVNNNNLVKFPYKFLYLRCV